ncbi:MAG TPA: hypothetical protein VKA95_10460 [Nitrososphaeraceae archaeon]|nr:hypothetical protein [Nitrososphaeraceae archaeon]
MQQVSSNSTQTSNEVIARQSINILRGIRKHLENNNCSHCKKLLKDIFFIENNNAGSPGRETTEHGRTEDNTTGDVL